MTLCTLRKQKVWQTRTSTVRARLPPTSLGNVYNGGSYLANGQPDPSCTDTLRRPPPPPPPPPTHTHDMRILSTCAGQHSLLVVRLNYNNGNGDLDVTTGHYHTVAEIHSMIWGSAEEAGVQTTKDDFRNASFGALTFPGEFGSYCVIHVYTAWSSATANLCIHVEARNLLVSMFLLK